MKPSRVVDRYWIHAWAPPAMRNSTPRVGKWLIFVPLAELDAAWAKIEVAVKAGELGPSAKARTSWKNFGDRDRKLVCVYTYDADDVEDRERVRRHLRRLGFKPKAYRTDAETLAGRSCE